LSANIHVSWLDPCKVRRVTAVGSQKMAVYNDLAVDERIRVLDKGVCLPPDGDNLTQPPMSYRYGDIVVPFISPDEPLAVQDRHFVECIANGTRPLTDAENGLAVVEALEAAELSRRLGRPVLLEETSSAGRFAVFSNGNGHAPKARARAAMAVGVAAGPGRGAS
jgi:predicted dehydrogenase